MTATRSIRFAFLLAAALPAVPASASSPESWEAFRAAVEAACRQAAGSEPVLGSVEVDPFGSERFGLALLRSEPGADGVSTVRICVFEKRTGAAEVGGELPGAMATPAAN